MTKKVVIYTRVSTLDQTIDNQLIDPTLAVLVGSARKGMVV